MRHLSFIVLFSVLLFSNSGFAQGETNVWYFGDGSGLDFNAGVNPDVLEDGAMETFEGCASICNSSGELLFYTDGVTVYRSDHQVMTNGNDLGGSSNSIQSSIIVPSPAANDNDYYVFTVDTDFPLGGDYYGLSYSVVDMDGFGGFGEVIEDQKNILLSAGPVKEGLTAVHHANGVDVWIISMDDETNVYETRLLTADGIESAPIVSDVSTFSDLHWQACLKAAPNGTKIGAVFSSNKKSEILDFDTFTGLLSNPFDLELDEDNVQEWAPYSCEFSPNGERFYISHLDYGPIVQYDLTADDVPASRTDIGINNGISGNAPFSTLQLAPNGKMYVACFGENFISVVNNPNGLGADCNWQDTVITFQNTICRFGLPQFVQSSFVESSFTFNEACRGDTSFFSPLNVYDSLYWDFGDIASGEDNYSTEENPFHIYETPGNYQVTLTVYLSQDEIISSSNLVIPGPTAFITPGDTIVCVGDYVEMTVNSQNPVSIQWFDDNPNETRWVQPPGTYWVTVDEGLCVASDTVIYETGDCAYMEYPNIFTPNNDGINDFFKYVRQWYVVEFDLKIYDRWGKLVFATNDQEIAWDGKNQKGQDCADGVYFLTVKYSGLQKEIETIEKAIQLTRYRDR